jgi:hypothetical protein
MHFLAIEITCGNAVGAFRYIGGCWEIHDIPVMASVRQLGISGWDSDTTWLPIGIGEK